MNNLMHGSGCYKWPDGKVYEGEYAFNLRHGFGKYTDKDKSVYEGYWE